MIASNILASIDLPLSRPSGSTAEDRRRLVCQTSHLPYYTEHSALPHHLYPFSLAAFSPYELSEQRSSHLSPSRCSNILVSTPSVVCAFIVRTMVKYPRYYSTRTVLDSDLGELVLYFFLGYTLHGMHKGEEEEWVREDEDRRIVAASQVVQQCEMEAG
jgi:hypothetical protein